MTTKGIGFLHFGGVVGAIVSAFVAGCPSQPPSPTGPTIGVSPGSLTFTAAASVSNPQDQTLQLSNTGEGTLAWSVSDNQDWLSVMPTSGSITTETVDLTVSVDITGLAAAALPYTGQITISAAGASNSPRTVEVLLTVTAPQCSVLSSTIDTDTTLAAGCYIAEGDIQVNGNATLTIQPGVTIIFEQNHDMTIGSTGRLAAVGSASQPIVFTGDEPIRGYWGGLRFYQSNSTQNRLEHVTIEYGGGWWDANLYLDGTASAPSRVSIANCTFRESETYGFYFDGDVVVEQFSGNVSTANTLGAGNVAAPVAGFLDDTSTYVGNAEDVVVVRGGTVESDQTWAGIDADYRVDGDVGFSAVVTIDPGARLVFTSGHAMTVNSDGQMWAVGTASDPIVFTGAEGIRGFWGGLRFYQSNSTDNRLEYVTIEYGGGWWNANLYLDGTASTPSRVNINNCTLRESGTYGFNFDLDSIVGEFANNIVTGNMHGAGSLTPEGAGFMDDTSTYTGNDLDAVEVRGGRVESDQTWPAIDADYLFTGSAGVSAALVIEPGARLVFQSSEEMTVNSDGSLSAVGTALEPIVFTGEQQTQGFWGGLRFYQSNSPVNRLDFVTIEYGGGWWNGNLYLDGTSSSPTQIQVTSCTITDSGSWGIYLDADTDVNVGIEDANTFSNNASGKVRWP